MMEKKSYDTHIEEKIRGGIEIKVGYLLCAPRLLFWRNDETEGKSL